MNQKTTNEWLTIFLLLLVNIIIFGFLGLQAYALYEECFK
mgnify:CR=1 FL=1